jgi:hypothetical protein
MTVNPPSPTTAVFPFGTRSAQEMIWEARKLACAEKYSYTEGWDDNTLVDIINLALNRCYNEITQIDSPPNIEEYVTGVISGQQIYPIPMDVHMALRIIDVRYLYSGPGQPYAFVTLRQGAIQDRFSYPVNIPDTYCIRDGTILLSPTPNLTLNNSLVINFQKRMRKLDIWRGVVSAIMSSNGTVVGVTNANPCQIATGAVHGLSTGNIVSLANIGGTSNLDSQYYIITVTGPTTYTLNGVDSTLFPPYTSGGFWFLNPIQFKIIFPNNSIKYVNMQANANSVLDYVQYCCFTDQFGDPVLDAISVQSFNSTTNILTCTPNYAFPDVGLTALQTALMGVTPVYVVQGDYASTHSELDVQCEDHLIEYMVLRLLRLQSSAEPTQNQMVAEESVLTRLRDAYRRYRPSVMPIVWMQRLRPMAYPFGRRGIF